MIRRIFMYLLPAVMDLAYAAVFFVWQVRMAQSGASAIRVTMLVAVWAVVYMLMCQIVGKLVACNSAVRLMLSSNVLLILISILSVRFSDLDIQYLFAVLMAISGAFFFTPFQVFMKEVEGDQHHNVIKATGLYTFSWSMGFAAGPFVAAMVWTAWGWEWCHGVNAILSVLTCITILLVSSKGSEEQGGAVEHHDDCGEAQPVSEYEDMPDFAWLGWVGAGMGIVALSIIRGVFPVTAAALEIPKPEQGIVLALLCLAQALTGLALIWSRIWMYRTRLVLLFGACGIAGQLLFASATEAPYFYLGALSFGVYSGSFFFYLVFHSLVHSEKSARYVAVNESVVGICGIAGSIGGGLIADYFSRSAPYLSGAVLVAIAVGLKVIIHRMHAGSEAPGPQS